MQARTPGKAIVTTDRVPQIAILHTDYNYRTVYASIMGLHWDRATRSWRGPATQRIAASVVEALGEEQCSSDVMALISSASLAGTDDYVLVARSDPWPHQKRAYNFCYPLHGAMLAADMGVGKTGMAIYLFSNNTAQRVLVVGPKSVLRVWAKEVAMHSAIDYSVHVLDQDSVKEKAQIASTALKVSRPTIIVVNYESVWREPLAKIVTGAEWDWVICDESHRLQAPGGKASRFIGRLGLRTPRRLCLSGTPLGSGPLAAYGQYRFLDPGIFGTSFTRFKARYAILGGPNNHIILGYQNEEEFSRKFNSIAFRCELRDVIPLPEPIYEQRTYNLGPRAAKIYRDLDKDFYAAVDAGEITVNNALTKLLRLQQVACGYILTDDREVQEFESERQDVLREILQDIPPTEPAVIFARFWHDLDAIKSVCEDEKRSCGELSGRANDLAEWQAGNLNVLAVQIQSGSEGNDFTRACYQVYYSQNFSLTNYEQSLRRIWRPGQNRTVVYITIVALKTVDEKIAWAIRHKKDIVEHILESRGQD